MCVHGGVMVRPAYVCFSLCPPAPAGNPPTRAGGEGAVTAAWPQPPRPPGERASAGRTRGALEPPGQLAQVQAAEGKGDMRWEGCVRARGDGGPSREWGFQTGPRPGNPTGGLDLMYARFCAPGRRPWPATVRSPRRGVSWRAEEALDGAPPRRHLVAVCGTAPQAPRWSWQPGV